jgi:hypothetical protein
MDMSARFNVSRRSLLLVFLFVVVLASSLFVCLLVNDSSGVSLTNAVHVKNEAELKNAINNASSKKSAITLDNDITLTDTITIPPNKDITLTSSKTAEYYKLVGPTRKSTINVENSGVLKIDGIIVTHVSGEDGRGIDVLANGQLIMYRGEISGNTNTGDAEPNTIGGFPSNGGGVYIEYGFFEMSGGKISNNKAKAGNGGGVYNLGGTIKMSGGEISNNFATQITVIGTWCGGDGGGVYNIGSFIMSGGTISSNTAIGNGDNESPNGGYGCGGGVYNINLCSLHGGTIIGNTADWGGGVYYAYSPPYIGDVVISGNTASTGDDM